MQFLITVLLDGLIYASYLFIVSLGLTITFGVMKILNVAHGGFFAWGAYLASISIIYLGDNEYNSFLLWGSVQIVKFQKKLCQKEQYVGNAIMHKELQNEITKSYQLKRKNYRLI